MHPAKNVPNLKAHPHPAPGRCNNNARKTGSETVKALRNTLKIIVFRPQIRRNNSPVTKVKL
jgi:hypothetical protein